MIRATCITLALALAIPWSTPAHAQDSSEADWLRNPAMGNYKGYAEFKMGHYAAARHVWEVLAGVGNTDALFNLGILAEDGLGEPRNLPKAETLYRAAADAGGFKAQYRLGMMYGDGGSLPPDPGKAHHYLSLAAAAGDQDAQARLARLAQPDAPASPLEQAERLASQGRHAEALALYRQAADAGQVRALTKLAWCHEAGRGTPADLATAARLFGEAARAGDAEAQYALAVMYRTGKGQPQDRAQSLDWLRKAAAQGYPPARAALAAEVEQGGDAL
ncbi:tetratricopeptide repeat protein [Zoogloea sp.]|uniref:tetratricopeptide repeat protein n=1 Tax=Zoogloea sp. TaxID=49181 RepID=UPI0035B115A6